MPTTVSGLTFFDETVETAIYQGLTQATAAFNERSGGGLLLMDGANKGLAPQTTFFQAIPGLIQDRDPASAGNLTPVSPQNTTHDTTKLFHSAPIIWRTQDWVDQGMTTEAGQRLYGINYGERLAEIYINTAISALLGAIESIGSDAQFVNPTPGVFDNETLDDGAAKAGDRRSQLTTLVAHSHSLNALSKDSITNQVIAFRVGNLNIFPASLLTSNMFVVNTDSDALVTVNAQPPPDQFSALLLFPGAIEIITGPSSTVFGLVTGTATATPENHTWLTSTESEFEIKVRGVSFTGAVKPVDADLRNLANWTPVGGENNMKNGPGIEVLTD